MIYLLRFIQIDYDYYVLEEEENELYYIPVEGNPISFDGYDDGDFFFYRNKAKEYLIVEGFTGNILSTNKSLKEAKTEAEEILLDNRQAFVNMILNNLKTQTLSPRFEKICISQ